MAFIAINTTADFANLVINADGADYDANIDVAFEGSGLANAMPIPALQEITVNATPGTFNWQQLDSLSERVVTTPSTNSVSVTLVLDPTTFFTGQGDTDGIFDIVNNKEDVYFRLYWAGSGAGDRYIQGKGYLTALAPTVSPGAPVWTTPLEILVDGDFTSGTV